MQSDPMLDLVSLSSSFPVPIMVSTAPAATTMFHSPAQPPLGLQDRLRLLLLSLSDSWSYAVFWRATAAGNASPYYGSGPATAAPLFHMSWSDGCIRSRSDSGQHGDCFGGNEVEWFYASSSSCTFRAGDGSAPARALDAGSPVWLCGGSELRVSGCERARQAFAHGIQTLVCIPVVVAVPGGAGFPRGVLELGSSEMVAADMALVRTAKFVLGLTDQECGGQPVAAAASVLTTCCVADRMVMPDGSLGCATSASVEQYRIKEEVTRILPQDSSDLSDSDDKVTGVGLGGGSCLLQDSGMMSPHSRRRNCDPKKRGRELQQQQRVPNQLPNHVQAERQRREKMNRRFYALRAAVPTVTRLDKASLLSDAVDYIKDLRTKVDELEAEAKAYKAVAAVQPGKLLIVPGDGYGGSSSWTTAARPVGVHLEVRLLRSEAIIRVQSDNENHPTAWLMDVLRDLGMSVQHASVSTVGDRMVQDVVAAAPAGIQEEEYLRAAILATLDVDTDAVRSSLLN